MFLTNYLNQLPRVYDYLLFLFFFDRYKLVNLKQGVSYTVKIYPYSGAATGRPSIIRIPASQLRTTSSRVWHMRIPRIGPNAVQLEWTEPWYGSAVEGMICDFLRKVPLTKTQVYVGSRACSRKLKKGKRKKLVTNKILVFLKTAFLL